MRPPIVLLRSPACARVLANPLLGVFIIIRYRAPRPETIKRAKTLCSFDSALAKLLGTFSLLFGVCGLWTLIEHLVPAASALWDRSSFEAEFDPLAGIKWNSIEQKEYFDEMLLLRRISSYNFKGDKRKLSTEASSSILAMTYYISS